MVSDSTESVMALTEELETALEQAQAQPQLYQCAQQMSRQVRQAMEKLREKCDALEMVVDRRDWPMPTYTDSAAPHLMENHVTEQEKGSHLAPFFWS